MIGSHLIKAWSRTQNHVTLSSAEAELYAMVKCTAELLGIKSMMADWGRAKSGLLCADSTAAFGIAKRKGAGKLRHINKIVKLPFRKALGTENPADLITKHLRRELPNGNLTKLGQEVREC